MRAGNVLVVQWKECAFRTSRGIESNGAPGLSGWGKWVTASVRAIDTVMRCPGAPEERAERTLVYVGTHRRARQRQRARDQSR